MSANPQIDSQPILLFSGQDFQAWESFEMKIQGLTVVVGPSNKGKSALYRAIRALFQNDLSQAYVRTGQKAVELTAVIGGHTITARRTAKGSTKYTVDGQPYAKLNGDLPEILEELNFKKLDFGFRPKLDPIFSRQMEKQFMLEESPSNLNAILGAFSSTDKLEEGKKEANLLITGCNSAAKNLAIEINAADTALARLEALAARSETIEADLQEMQPYVVQFDAILAALRTLVPAQERLERLQYVVTSLDIPDISAATHAIATTIALDVTVTATKRLDQLKSIHERLSPPALDGLLHAERVLTAVSGLVLSQRRFEVVTGMGAHIATVAPAYEALVKSYKEVKAIREIVTLTTPQYEVLQSTSAKLGVIVDGLATFAAPLASSRSALTEIEALIAAQDKSAQLNSELATSAKRLEALDDEREAIQRGLRAAQEAASKIECPKCGECFTPEHQQKAA